MMKQLGSGRVPKNPFRCLGPELEEEVTNGNSIRLVADTKTPCLPNRGDRFRNP
jgi:hypothetical protein